MSEQFHRTILEIDTNQYP